MLGLSAANLLELTDQADGLDWVGRGLLLSEYAWPDSSVEDRRSLPVGVRDRLIMALRVATFGRTLDLRTRCQACGAELEAALDAAVMLDGSGGIAAAPTSVTIELDGERYEVRLPSTDDLLSTAAVAAPEAEWALLA